MAERVFVWATMKTDTGLAYGIDMADGDLFSQWAARLIRAHLAAGGGRYTIEVRNVHVVEE